MPFFGFFGSEVVIKPPPAHVLDPATKIAIACASAAALHCVFYLGMHLLRPAFGAKAKHAANQCTSTLHGTLVGIAGAIALSDYSSVLDCSSVVAEAVRGHELNIQ